MMNDPQSNESDCIITFYNLSISTEEWTTLYNDILQPNNTKEYNYELI